MKKLVLFLIFFPSVVSASGHLEARRADLITINTIPSYVLDNDSITKYGSSIPQAAIIGLVAATESTYTLTLGGYGVFPSTYLPVEGATFKVSKATLQVAGIDAWINKPSSVAPTVFMIFHSSGGGYGINWSSMTPAIAVLPDSGSGNQARQSVYISTVFPVYDGNFIGVGISSLPTSGVPPVDWGVNIHTLIRRAGVTW